MKKKSNTALALIIIMLFITAVPTCYFIAQQNNPNDPKNLNEDMGLPVADTGQTLCYDSTGTRACNEDPVGWPRQDGFYANKPNPRSFTGPTQHPTYTNDYTTKDNLTGLVWKSCVEGKDGATCENDNEDLNIYMWDNAAAACTALNSKNSGAGYAGRTTWRLPTVQELRTLIDYGVSVPSIDTVRFPGTPGANHWSTSIYARTPGYTWAVNFMYGFAYGSAKNCTYYVRCVVNGQ